MSAPVIRVALPKLFLWNEAGRIQEYPEALSRAEAGRRYTRVEVERDLFDIVATMRFNSGAPRGRRTDGVVNTYGLERSGSRYRINGLNLLVKSDKRIIATDEGLELGRSFREDPNGAGWVRALARQIIRREPRTRLVIGLLLQGYGFDVSLSGTIPTGLLALIKTDGQRVTITQRNCQAFNELLGQHAEMALGPAWRADLDALGETGPISWEGVRGGTPSTNDLPTALKKVLALFFHIDAFSWCNGAWCLNGEVLQRTLQIESLISLGFDTDGGHEQLTDDKAFERALAETTGEDGFAVASQLAHRFGELLGVPAGDRANVLDSFIRNAVYHDQLRILEHHPGQPRMGRGLFGEPANRRIRIDFHPVSDTTNTVNLEPAPEVLRSQTEGGD